MPIGAALIALNLSLDADHDAVHPARATGMALYAGTVLLAWWLLAAATGPEAYAQVQAVSSAWYGRLVLFGYTWALLHHMFGGLRHFVWDTGRGFDLKRLRRWRGFRHLSHPF